MKSSLTLHGSLNELAEIIALIQDNGYGATAEAQHTAVLTPPASAVAQTIASLATPGAPVELDAHGLPWDERIHASTRTRKADQTWTRRKKVAEAVVNAVEAELRAQFPNVPTATPLPVAAQPVPTAFPVAAATIAPSPQPIAVPMAPVPPAMMAVPVAPVPVAVVPAGPPTNLHELMQALQPLIDPAQGGLVTPEYLQHVVAEANQAWGAHLGGKALASLADIAAFPNLTITQWIWQVLQRDGKVA